MGISLFIFVRNFQYRLTIEHNDMDSPTACKRPCVRLNVKFDSEISNSDMKNLMCILSNLKEM